MQKFYALFILTALCGALQAQDPCPDNHALDFDGLNDYVQLNNTTLTGNSNFTIEARFYRDPAAPNPAFTRRLFSLGGVLPSGNTRFDVYEVNGQLNFQWNNTVYPADASTPLINDGNWHHLAAVRNGANFKVYLDGDLVKDQNVFGDLNITTFRLGSSWQALGKGVFWDGKIDEVRIWNVARTEAEIDPYINCSLPNCDEPNLKAYFKFNQGVAEGNNAGVTSLIDCTANNLNGTLTSAFALTGNFSNWVCSDSLFNISCCPADFSWTSDSCGNVQFTNLTQQPVPPAYTYDWDFDNDGTTDSNTANPSWNFSTSGTYTVCLSLIDASGAVVCVTCKDVNISNVSGPPVIVICPPDVTLDCNQIYSTSPPIVDPNPCANGQVIQPDNPINAIYPVGITVITWTATNEFGSSTCTNTVTVIDNVPPIALCKDITVNLSGSSVTASPSAIDNGSYDDCCPGVTLSVPSGLTFDCSDACPPIPQTATLVVTDCSGNTATCTSQVTVIDAEAPMVVCINQVTIQLGTFGFAHVSPDDILTGLPIDNCSVDTVFLDTYDFDCSVACGPPQVVTLTAVDCAGNTAQCWSNVEVVDGIPPTITCPSDMFLISDPGSCGTFFVALPTALADNCANPVTLSYLLEGATFDNQQGPISAFFVVGPTLCTYTAVDDCGNSATCSFQVIVDEFEPPLLLNCPQDIIISAGPSAGGANASWALPIAIDNCFDPIITSTHSSDDFFPCGVTTVTYTAADFTGNSATCTFTVTVNCPPDSCTCGGFDNLTFGPVGGKLRPVVCDTSVFISCPVAGQNFEFNGDFGCNGNCQPSGLNWQLIDVSTGNSVASGTAGTNFTIPIDGNDIATPGTYHLTLTGYCGQDTCTCGLWLVAPECPDSLCGTAIVTCFAGATGNVAAAIKDIRNLNGLPVGTDISSNVPGIKMWNKSEIGEVFGIAIDKDQNIYLTSTTVYGPTAAGPSGYGGVYKIDRSTLNVDNSWLVSLPNFFGPCVSLTESGCGSNYAYNHAPGLGNICYDKYNNALYVSNFEDGSIYKIDPSNGSFSNVYDPVLVSPDDGSAGFAPLGERIWGIGVTKNHLGEVEFYYSVWSTDLRDKNLAASTTHNTIRRVIIDNSGNFDASTDVEVIELPYLAYAISGGSCSYPDPQFSNPVSDIEFSSDGNTMLLAERTMHGDIKDNNSQVGFRWAHGSRLLEYHRTGSIWGFSRIIDVGSIPTGTLLPQAYNSAGGVDFAEGSNHEDFAPCDSMIWVTGDYLHQLNSGELIYGMQGFATNASTILNSTSYLIDFDNETSNYDKALIGDVDVFKCLSCAADCDTACIAQTLNISTGYDPITNGLLAPGNADAFWTTIAVPATSNVVPPMPANVIGPYGTSWIHPAGSEWISAVPFNNYSTNNCTSGDCTCDPFIYERCFCLCESDSVTFDFNFLCDDRGEVVLWDGTSEVYSFINNCDSTGKNFLHADSVHQTLFLPQGNYCLRIKHWNTNSVAMGVNLQGTVSGLNFEKDTCCASPVGGIVGTKYRDLNCDGIRDFNTTDWEYIDPGLSGWTFTLTGNGITATAVTDVNGLFYFPNLPPGTYTITETGQPLYEPSDPASGTVTVTVNAFDITEVEFGNCWICDFITPTVSNDTTQNGCCHTFSVDNNKPDYFTYINLSVLDGGSLVTVPQPTAGPNWQMQAFSPSHVLLQPNGSGTIPTGTQQVLDFCLENLTADEQTILVEFYDLGDTVVCRDTIKLKCDACMQAIVDSAYCEGINQYSANICIKAGELLQTPSGSATIIPLGSALLSVDPPNITNPDGSVIVSLPDIAPGDTYCSIPIHINGAAGGETVCFYAVIHDGDITADELDGVCCADTVPICFTLPKCDPCDSTVTYATANQVVFNGDSCCWNITVHNPPNYFIGVNTTITTPGISFSAINNFPPTSGWIVYTAAPYTDIWWEPTLSQGTYVVDGQALSTVCFDGSAPSPWSMTVTWVAEDSTVCNDDLVFNCWPDSAECVRLDDYNLDCIDDNTYIFNFDITNVSNYPAITADHIELQQIKPAPPPSDVFDPAILWQTLPPNTSGSFSTLLYGNPGDTICFVISLHDVNDDSLHLNCCNSDTFCVVLPPCNPQLLVCEENILVDGDFLNTYDPQFQTLTDFWVAYDFSSPSFITYDSCHLNNAAQMKGSQLSGSGIYQKVNFTANHLYAIQICARHVDPDPSLQPKIRLFADDGTSTYPTSGCTLPNCELIGYTPVLGTDWAFYTFNWTADNNYTRFILTPWNQSVVPGQEVPSTVRVDGICVDDYGIVLPSRPALKVRAYPNPTTGDLTLAFERTLTTTATLRVFDMLGRQVKTERVPESQLQHELSLNGLPTGVYFVEIDDAEGRLWGQRIVKE